VNARIAITLKDASVEKAQKTLDALLGRLKAGGIIEQYSFEIETEAGIVTEKCIFSEGNVIA
jgi:phosphoribosylformylglycinamidine (FGAM) synthase PurS component